MIASIQKAHGCIFFLFNDIIKAQAAQPAISDRPLPAQQLQRCSRLSPQQPRCRHLSPVAATASTALPQPQPLLPMPLPPMLLRCAPMQPQLHYHCHLCHLQPLLRLIVVFQSQSCEPTSTDAAAATAVANAGATCRRLSANPTAAADATICS